MRIRTRAHNPVRMAFDALAWVVGVLLAWAVASPSPGWLLLLGYAVVVVAGQLVVGGLLLYRGRYRSSSQESSLALVRTVGIVALAGALVCLVLAPIGSAGPRPGVTLALVAPTVALGLSLLSRILWRAYRERRRAQENVATDVIVYGAGEAGEQLLRLLKAPEAPYRAVGLLDDDPAKQNLRLSGVPVLGPGSQLEQHLDDLQVDTVILAMGRPNRDLVSDVSARLAARDDGTTLRVLPPVAEIVDGQVRLSDVRDVDVTDILGRHPISTDISSIAGYLAGRRVLVTGAGGSIGSELARQLHHLRPASLVLLDRDESALHATQLTIYGQGLLDTPDIVLADIRDTAALRAVFTEHRPEVVFHAAALKHLPMLERFPDEGWKTNVEGTAHLLELALETDVERFVNISTDKAADPTSVLGRSKLLAERLTAAAAERSGRPYLSVRFGNVLGSRGSMLGTFQHQILHGGPVTVTDPDVTRYFMTIPEACELVLQAGALGRGGEVLVLDMGEPVRILDVARMLIARSGREIPIVFTGLRHGEKLHEDLFSSAETSAGHDDDAGRPRHPLISHVAATPITGAELMAEHAAWPQHAAEISRPAEPAPAGPAHTIEPTHPEESTA
ncbi:polysaccharide biosynthesis protein [Salana multivorans]